ncbi:hypothetical protein STEG23_028747, partial [Scotinomys teguina]
MEKVPEVAAQTTGIYMAFGGNMGNMGQEYQYPAPGSHRTTDPDLDPDLDLDKALDCST